MYKLYGIFVKYVIFDRFIDVVWIIHLYMKRFQPNENYLNIPKILLIPYLFGEIFKWI